MKKLDMIKNLPYVGAFIIGICVWVCILVAISIPAGSLLISYLIAKDMPTLRKDAIRVLGIALCSSNKGLR